MQRVVLLGFLWALFSHASAQQIIWGEDPRSNSKNFYFAAIGENEKGIYVLSHSRRRGDLTRFSIDRYNHELLFANSKNVSLKNQVLQKIYVFPQDVFFTSIPEKKRLGKQSLKGFLINHKLEEYTLQKELMSLNRESQSQSLFFKVKSSNQGVATGAFGFAENRVKKSMGITYNLFDEKLNQTLSKKTEIDFVFEESNIKDFYTDPFGNYYLAIDKLNKDLKAGKGKFETQLIYFNLNKDIMVQLAITDPEFKVSDCSFSYDDSLGVVVLSGFYGLEITSYQKGLFQIGIDAKDGQIIFNTFTEIPESFVEEVVGRKLLNQGVQLSQFYLKKVVRTFDCKTIIIAERYFSDTYSDQFWANGVPISTTRRLYNYDELVVFCLDSLGNINWNTLIRKKQTSEEDFGYFSSILTTVTPNFISIIFNEKISSVKDVVEYKIFEDGRVENAVLLPSDSHNTFIIPVEGRQIGYNRSVIPITRKGDYSLIKINYSNSL
jgi:hypothetical protein